jgi:hypothetical protein
MMANKEAKNTSGHLKANITGEEVFYSEKVRVLQRLEDGSYQFDADKGDGEWLALVVRTLNVEVGKSYKIDRFGGEGTANAVYYASYESSYNGILGEVKVTKFDQPSQTAVVEANVSAVNDADKKKTIEAKGSFEGFEVSNLQGLEFCKP